LDGGGQLQKSRQVLELRQGRRVWAVVRISRRSTVALGGTGRRPVGTPHDNEFGGEGCRRECLTSVSRGTSGARFPAHSKIVSRSGAGSPDGRHALEGPVRVTAQRPKGGYYLAVAIAESLRRLDRRLLGVGRYPS